MNKTPTLPIETIDDVLHQIVGSVNCKRSGCHGKGYIGIRVEDGGRKTVMLCECAQWKETDYVRFVKLATAIHNDVVKVQTYLVLLNRRTFFGGILHLFHKITDKWASIWKRK